MNWYIYWHLAVEEYCGEICLFPSKKRGLIFALTSLPIMIICGFLIQIAGQQLAIPLLENYAIKAGIALGIIDCLLLYDGSKRYRRWRSAYEKCRTDEKDMGSFILACLAFLGMLVILYTEFGALSLL